MKHTPALANISAPRKRRSPFRRGFALWGPAFAVAVSYVDPGNYATNIQAGSQFGYALLWVVLWSNLIGVLVQLLSSKLGLAASASLATLLRDHLPRWAVWLYWAQAEVLAIFTDLAEFIGASLGFQLLFGISLFQGALWTAVLSWLILTVEYRGLRRLEIVIGVFLGSVALAYIVELALARPSPLAVAKGMFVPHFAGPDSGYLAAGILGATVMPHVIYLHSALSQADAEENPSLSLRSLFRANCWDVGIAMTIASFVNLAMLSIAAVEFFGAAHPVKDIATAYKTLQPLAGGWAASLFGASLVVAGLSSTVVGTLAGQQVMQGFLHFSIPVWIRRLVTMAPSFFVIVAGFNITMVLVMSQVVLSFGIAFALMPLILFTSRAAIMRELVNGPMTQLASWIVMLLIIALNAYVLLHVFR